MKAWVRAAGKLARYEHIGWKVWPHSRCWSFHSGASPSPGARAAARGRAGPPSWHGTACAWGADMGVQDPRWPRSDPGRRDGSRSIARPVPSSTYRIGHFGDFGCVHKGVVGSGFPEATMVADWRAGSLAWLVQDRRSGTRACRQSQAAPAIGMEPGRVTSFPAAIPWSISALDDAMSPAMNAVAAAWYARAPAP